MDGRHSNGETTGEARDPLAFALFALAAAAATLAVVIWQGASAGDQHARGDAPRPIPSARAWPTQRTPAALSAQQVRADRVQVWWSRVAEFQSAANRLLAEMNAERKASILATYADRAMVVDIAAGRSPIELVLRDVPAPAVEGVDELIVLAPPQAKWRAGVDWRLYGYRPTAAARLVGGWIGHAKQYVAAAPSQVRAAIASRRNADGPLFSSPAALSRGPLLVGPSDRLAMAPPRQAESRDLLSGVLSGVLSGDEGDVGAPTPEALLASLKALESDNIARGWSSRARQQVATSAGLVGARQAAASFDQLEALVAEGRSLAELMDDGPIAIEVRRVCYAIERRLGVWRLTHAMASEAGNGDAASLAGNPSWANHWLTEQLADVLARPTAVSTQRLLAELVAGGTEQPMLSASDRRAIVGAPPGGAGQELVDLLQEGQTLSPAQTRRLLARLEQHELAPSLTSARRIAHDTRRLADSRAALERQLAAQIDRRYRNANLRIAVTEEMLQRFAPPSEPRTKRVHDRIAGELVRGRSVTDTDVAFRLVPHATQWRLEVVARGAVRSRTYATPGVVVLRNAGVTQFEARKLLTIDPAGMQTAPAVVSADARGRLVDVSSNFDRVPLLGRWVDSYAREEYAERRGVVRRQTEQRVRSQVEQEFEASIAPALARLEDRFRTGVAKRADELGVQITPIELRTTNKRLVARMRVANQEQLAAYTPRNRAPGDSAASIQVHQSLVNNAVAGLDLAGREFSAEELRQHIRKRLQIEGEEIASMPDDERALIRFAEKQPVAVTLREGRAEVVLNIAEMHFRNRHTRNFKIHAFYVPAADGMTAQMERDGGLHIEGRLRTAARIQMHAVFNQVLPEDRPATLLTPAIARDERLAGLKVTQLVIADGWLGLAIGPASVNGAERIAAIGRYVR